MIKWNEVTWYSRLGALVLFLAVIPALCFYIGTQYELVFATLPLTNSKEILQKNSILEVNPTVTTFKFDDSILQKGQVNFETNSTYKAPITGDTLSFRLLTDEAHQAPNPSFEAYLNGKAIGEVGGLIISLPSFSPDNKYFAFRSQYVCGAGCDDFGMTVIDLQRSKIINLKISVEKETKQTENSSFKPVHFIESYSWLSEGVVDLSVYSIERGESDQAYSRISPKQLWEYDLNTRGYKLIKMLPEPRLTSFMPDTHMAGYVDSKKNISPDTNYSAVSESDEQGDAAVYIRNSKGTLFTNVYCGFFDSWATSSQKIKVFVPTVCLTGSRTAYFYLHVDGTVQPVEGSTYIPPAQ